ncbi:YqzL family protein [Cohnella nanjingensis]|uniref:YqzL family protein n=1 Tax=Cohnella nanjingensis TaxID=1387779 RepID=A0A7X0S0A1_9BACL|nr:YqzL family protein [Cohnella nanjingensis]MBB6675304.1 YqzL family protein [Cohnella nanjingensis]
MRDFTWHVFTQTGDIEAYLLYKEMNMLGTDGLAPEPDPDRDDGEAVVGAAST